MPDSCRLRRPRTWVPVAAAVLLLGLLVAPSAQAGPAVPTPDLPVDPTDVLDVVDPARTERAPARAGVGAALVGTFALDAGSCGGPGGSYFRMVQPGGSPGSGPYVDNNDSPCDPGTVTPLRPGTDGGLITGSYQPHPEPAFQGNAGRADRITQPEPFFGTDFAAATNPTDPQTGTAVPAPEIRVGAGGALSGDLRSFAAAWQTQHFNQGAPKPDGSASGGTSGPTGTYDAATGRFMVEWSSQIEGGAFNNFTGVWHLEGVFRPAGGATPASGSGAPGSAGGSVGGPTTAGAPGAPADGSAGGPSSLAKTGRADDLATGAVLLAAGLGGAALRRRSRATASLAAP